MEMALFEGYMRIRSTPYTDPACSSCSQWYINGKLIHNSIW